jgi:LPS-assembly protein
MRDGEMKTDNSGITAGKMYMLLFLILSLLVPVPSTSAEEPLKISSDYLEYISKENTYLGKGNVRIYYKDLKLFADEVRFNNLTADAAAYGNVIYESREMTINADKLELNLESRLGTIYNSYILYKKRNYHIRGGDLKKTGAESYQLDHATVTTCNAEPPEWYISARDIRAVQHQKLTSRDTRFYIKGLPVFYTPYFALPLLGRRQTGILNPSLGYTNTKGFTYKQGFFWAPKENMDATLYLDYFSNKGFGKGLDYRYITDRDTLGEVWIYHLRDNDLARDFTEIKSYHNRKFPYNISGYLKVHAVNEFDYYQVLESTPPDRFGLTYMEPALFGFSSDERQQKYLESNLHFSKPFSGGRVYLLGQYRQNLEGSSGTIPQNLPELGLVLNTTNRGPFSFNATLMSTNFWREDGQMGERIDLNPNIYLSFGRTVNITQKIGVRETAYFLRSPDRNENRAIFDLNTSLSTRFLKKFSSFNHIVEPAIEYTYIPAVDHDGIPTFDSVDSIPQTSLLTYSLTNRLAGSSSARFRLSQGYSFLSTDEPFTPVLAEGTFSNGRINFSINTSYDVYAKNITDMIASLYLRHEKGFIGIGKNFRRSTLLDQYSVEAGLKSPIEIYDISIPLNISGNLWYDLKGAGVQELNLKSVYQRQCWGFTVSYIRKPHEYQIMFGIEFTGLGTVQLL